MAMCHETQDCELFSSYQLIQLITKPTHILGNVLDLLFTNRDDVTVIQMPVYYSDHHLIGGYFPIPHYTRHIYTQEVTFYIYYDLWFTAALFNALY